MSKQENQREIERFREIAENKLKNFKKKVDNPVPFSYNDICRGWPNGLIAGKSSLCDRKHK